MIHSRGANASDAEIVWSQLLQGIGGGFAAVCAQVAAQASAPHADVAMVTAVVLLITEIGGSIGGAIGKLRCTFLHITWLATDSTFFSWGSMDEHDAWQACPVSSIPHPGRAARTIRLHHRCCSVPSRSPSTRRCHSGFVSAISACSLIVLKCGRSIRRSHEDNDYCSNCDRRCSPHTLFLPAQLVSRGLAKRR